MDHRTQDCGHFSMWRKFPIILIIVSETVASSVSTNPPGWRTLQRTNKSVQFQVVWRGFLNRGDAPLKECVLEGRLGSLSSTSTLPDLSGPLPPHYKSGETQA